MENASEGQDEGRDQGKEQAEGGKEKRRKEVRDTRVRHCDVLRARRIKGSMETLLLEDSFLHEGVKSVKHTPWTRQFFAYATL